jgi:hypothetical protein
MQQPQEYWFEHEKLEVFRNAKRNSTRDYNKGQRAR